MELVFTELYENNEHSQTSTLPKTEQLRQQIPNLIKILNLKSIVDCGCGDFQWMNDVDLSGIQYTGIDIVKSLVEINQTNYTTLTRHFTLGNVCKDPPFDGDFWLARDLICLWSLEDFVEFIKRFLDSSALYLALTSIETSTPNAQDGILGIWKRINVRQSPLSLPAPFIELQDGQQWFCPKKLFVYSRGQIEEWFAEFESKEATFTPVDRNAHLKGNVSLRDIQLGL